MLDIPRGSISYIQQENERRDLDDDQNDIAKVESIIDEDIEPDEEFTSYNQKELRDDRDKKLEQKGTDGYF